MSTNVAAHQDATGQPRQRAIGRWTRGVRALYASLLVGTVLASLVPAVLFQPHSRVFLLKLVAVALLASLPRLLYLEFIRFKGQTLYDEYVINLFRLGIDLDCNLPAPPQHTSYYGRWKKAHDKLTNPGKDNLYRKKFEAVYGQQAVSTRSQFTDLDSRPERSEGFSQSSWRQCCCASAGRWWSSPSCTATSTCSVVCRSPAGPSCQSRRCSTASSAPTGSSCRT